MGSVSHRHAQIYMWEVSRVDQNYRVPISDNLDSDVPLVPSRGQTVPRTTQIPHVEVQAICAEWNIERISKW